MSKASFESELRSSLETLSQSAPVGPTQADVMDALQQRSMRRQTLRAQASIVSLVLVLVIGLSWLILANLAPSGFTPEPATAVGDPIEQGDLHVNASGDGSITAAFNTAALLGHMDDIPFERSLMLHVAELDIPAMPAPNPAWNSTLALDKIDFAYLPAQGDCLFCVAVPNLPGHRPF